MIYSGNNMDLQRVSMPIKAESQSERQTWNLMAAELVSEMENPSNMNAEKSIEIIERVASILFNI
jgi:hypothetical protein